MESTLGNLLRVQSHSFSRYLLTIMLVFIFITVFIDLLGYGMVLPLLPFYVQAEHGSAAIAGALGSLYALMQLLSGPIIGGLSDRYGRRPVLLICLLGTAGAYALLGLANSLPLIFLAVMLDGITGGNLSTANAYIADVTPPDQRARGFGIVGAAFGLGLMSGPVVGGLLSQYGLAVPAFVACGIALSNVVWGYFKLPESLPIENRTKRLEFRQLNSFTQLWQLARLSNLQVLLGAVFLVNLAFSGLQTNFPLYSAARFLWTAFDNGIFFAFVGVCAVVVQGVIVGRVQPRLGDGRLAVSGLALMSVGLLGVAAAPQAWVLYPVVAVVALGSGVSIPALTSLISKRMGADEQGRMMGGLQVLLSLTTIIGPTLAGIVFERITPSAPYYLGALFAASALLLAWRMKT